jgi:hypothetical protein
MASTSSNRRGPRGRLLAVGLIALACAGIVGTAAATPASGGRHLPYFSVMSKRVAISKLPLEIRFLIQGPPGAKRPGPLQVTHGPVWFGEVERPSATIELVGNRHVVCEWEEPADELKGGGGGTCTTFQAARELSDLSVGSCGKGPARHFRIHALVPDGVTGLTIEKEDGTIGRTVPVLDNTVAFTIGREDFTMHGVGDAAAERLERSLPLAEVGGGGRGGCSFYVFAEEKKGSGE